MIIYAQPCLGKTYFCQKSNNMKYVDADDLLVELSGCQDIEHYVGFLKTVSKEELKMIDYELFNKIHVENKNGMTIFVSKYEYIPIANLLFVHNTAKDMYHRIKMRGRIPMPDYNSVKKSYDKSIQRINFVKKVSKKQVHRLNINEYINDYADLL